MTRVRYHDTPGADSRCGSDTLSHDESSKPGSDHPGRSPNRPPLFCGPRTRSTRASPPRTPWMRQLTGASEPTTEADSSPRGAFCASFLPPSSLWPMLRTSTEMTLSWPAESRPAGSANVALEFWLPVAVPVRTVPRCVPLTHTCQAPARPVPAVSASAVSLPVAVKCPRYQTSP